MSTCTWGFEPAGEERSGHPAAFQSFDGDLIKTFIRESAQNSVDVAERPEGGAPKKVKMIYKIVDLSGECLEEFLTSISFDTLQDNIHSAAGETGLPDGTAEVLEQSLEALIEAKSGSGILRLLIVEDFNTLGLLGNDVAVNTQYHSLLRSSGVSNKNEDGTGGSKGIGKNLYWMVSGLKTVVCVSSARDHNGLKVLGKCILPEHETTEDGRVRGGGYLGRDVEGSHKRKFLSDVDAVAIADACSVKRKPDEHGTSIISVGVDVGDEFVSDFKAGLAEVVNYQLFPAVAGNLLEVEFEHWADGELKGQERIQPDEEMAVALHKMYAEYKSGETVDRLPESEETAAVEVQLRVPERNEGKEEYRHEAFTAKGVLLCRLVSVEPEKSRNNIHAFRGGMYVVENISHKSFVRSAEFISALCIGIAKNDPSEQDRRVDRFLKACENAQHTSWSHTRDTLKMYKKVGIKKILDDLREEVRVKAKQLFEEKAPAGESLPKELLGLLGPGSGPSGHREYLSITQSQAARPWIQGTPVIFDQVVSRQKWARDEGGAWQIKIQVFFEAEGQAKGVPHHCITTNPTAPGAVDISLENPGSAKAYWVIQMPANKDEVPLKFETNPAKHLGSKQLSVEISGSRRSENG